MRDALQAWTLSEESNIKGKNGAIDFFENSAINQY